MLARTVGPKFNQYPCYVQPKLNGVRALFQRGQGSFSTFQSRDEKTWNPAVLKHLSDELCSMNLGSLILDGELYRHSWRLQQINGAVAVNRTQPREDTGEVEYHVFDIVDPNQCFSDRYLEARKKLVCQNTPHIRVVPTGLAYSWTEVAQYFHKWTAEGYEGIMLRPDGKYEFGEHLGRGGTMTSYRSKTLWKHKQWEDDEFECVSITQGEGKAEIGIGALVLLKHNAEIRKIDDKHREFGVDQTFKVGTGLTNADRIAFSQNPPIGKLVRVRYLCLTADGIPFNPSFIAVL